MLENKILWINNFTFNVSGGSTNYCLIIKAKKILTYHQQQCLVFAFFPQSNTKANSEGSFPNSLNNFWKNKKSFLMTLGGTGLSYFPRVWRMVLPTPGGGWLGIPPWIPYPLHTLPPDTLLPAYSTPEHPPTTYPSSPKRTWDQRYPTSGKDLVPGLPYPFLWTDKHLWKRYLPAAPLAVGKIPMFGLFCSVTSVRTGTMYVCTLNRERDGHWEVRLFRFAFCTTWNFFTYILLWFSLGIRLE